MVTEVLVEVELVSLSSLDDVIAVSDVEFSEFAQEFKFRPKNKISSISMKKSFRLEVFFNEKEMRTPSNKNEVNIISHFGIVERS